MRKSKIAYEQYCFVLGRNIVVEETLHEDGKREVLCTNHKHCLKDGGCKNQIFLSNFTNCQQN